jgi:hypothetical protein
VVGADRSAVCADRSAGVADRSLGMEGGSKLRTDVAAVVAD